ncbi:MAG: right-handed parallel beta-helix repeat-containing protein [Patescibacteria group bacterium]
MKKAKLAIFFGFFIIATLFFVYRESFAQSAGTSDAIGVRIIPNPNHYSVYRWYDSQGFSGSPQALAVDGYEAIRDGRTVYVNAANVKGKSIYTNIYLISYNQDPSPKTVDILGQIVKNWKFNSDLIEASNPGPQCTISALSCASDKDCDSTQLCATSGIASSSCQLKTALNCTSDDDCPDNFFCSSVKAKIIRDINRIGKTEELKDALYAYKSVNGSYPRLSAGSYLSGYTMSVWPSWQNTFLPALATAQNIVDPINRLGACAGYDAKTCWSESAQRFFMAPTNSYLPLPAGSYGFVYKTDLTGSDYNLCAVMETREATALLGFQFAPNNPTVSSCVTATGIISDGGITNSAPVLIESYLTGEADQEFNGSVKVIDAEDNPLVWALNTSGQSWSGWPSAPVLKDTSNLNQKKVYAPLAGSPGTYTTRLTVYDNLGAVMSTITPLVIINPKPLIEADDGVYTLNPKIPFSYSFYFSDNNLAAPASAFSFIKLSGASNLTLAGFSSSLVPAGHNRYQVTYQGTIPTTSKFYSDSDYLYRVTVRDKYNATTTKDIKITLKIEAPVLSFDCPPASRLGQAYTCLLGSTKQGDHTISYSATNLPAGISIATASTSLVSLIGTTNTLGSQELKILGTNEYGATSSRAFTLKVNSYCGDGLKQIPNSEGRGGIYNDGYEDCDGSAGVSVNSGVPVVSADPTLQYACSTYSSGTPYPIPNNNYCIFKSAIDGGGYCGDGFCQSLINYNGTEYPLENYTNCIADCDPTCVPSCVGSVCGDDGCGGTCGSCGSDKCIHGKCVVAAPGCSACGDSVCAGSETATSCPFDCTYGACLKDSDALSADQLCLLPISPGNCDSVHCVWQTNHCEPRYPSPSVEDCNALSTEDSCNGPIYGCVWDPTAHKNYLWCGDGQCTAENGENSTCCSADCGLPADTAKPIVMTFNIPSTSSLLTIPILAFTASDNTAVIGYALTETALAPAVNSSAWKIIAPTSYTFASAGSKTLYAWAIDEADNISSAMSRTVTITTNTTGGTSYYISSSSGNDTYTATQAQNPATPWKSIAKVNAQTFGPGTSILFKRGDVWSGETIVVNSSGSVSSPITYGSYGTGNQPVISGFTTLTGWTNEGGGIYSKVISPQSAPRIVTVNGVNTAMGRWPNAGTTNGGYLTFESNNGTTSITDNQLPSLSTNNWTGAEIVTRTNKWWIDRSKIASQSGGTITYATPIRYAAIPGYGYFIQNDLRTLDQLGEWYYNSTTKKLSMFFGANSPSAYVVKVSTTDELFSSISKNYITLDSLSFAGANTSAVRFRAPSAANFVSVKNCNIDTSGLDAIYVDGSTSNIAIDSCNINNSQEHGIYIGVSSTAANTARVANNNISHTALFPGVGISYNPDNALTLSCNNSLVENNVISSTGFNGMSITGERSNVTVRNNLISDSCLIKDDCAGIYVGTKTYNNHPTNYIQNNIVLNSVGNHDGVKAGTTVIAHGIYLDDSTENTAVSYNTAAYNAGGGIYLGYATKNDTVIHNVSYNNGHQLWTLRGDGVINPAFTITDNIFFAKDLSKDLVFIDNSDPALLGTLNNNYYERPLNDDNVFYIAIAPIYPRYKLSEWQSAYHQDLNSHISPITITDPNDVRFEYNATAATKTISLGTTVYVDVTGVIRTGSINLAPYYSLILIKSK